MTSKSSPKAIGRKVVDKCTPDILTLPTTRQKPLWAQRFPQADVKVCNRLPKKLRSLIDLMTSSSVSEYTLVWLFFANKNTKQHWWRKTETGKTVTPSEMLSPWPLFSMSPRRREPRGKEVVTLSNTSWMGLGCPGDESEPCHRRFKPVCSVMSQAIGGAGRILSCKASGSLQNHKNRHKPGPCVPLPPRKQTPATCPFYWNPCLLLF